MMPLRRSNTQNAPNFEHLSFVTPVWRVNYLGLIHELMPVEAEWICVTDGPKNVPDYLSAKVIEGPLTEDWGDTQRSIAIEHCTRDYIYFLDDDNLFSPTSLATALSFLKISNADACLFGLVAHYFSATCLWPPPKDIALGNVDTAMLIVRRARVYDLRRRLSKSTFWPSLDGRRGADYEFIRALDQEYEVARLPGFFGFHNALSIPCLWDKLKNREKPTSSDLPEILQTFLVEYLDSAVQPKWE